MRAPATPPLPLLVSLALVAGPLLACGYGFVDGRAAVGGEGQRIAIRMFENRSVEPGLERMIADALQEEFLRRGELVTLLGPRTDADMQIEGVIRDVTVSTSALSSVALTLEDEVTVVLDLAIRRSGEGGVILRHEGLRYGEHFLASADPQVYESNKEQALRRLTAELASRIHDELYQAY